MTSIKVGTFNVLNLALPGETFYTDQPAYDDAEFNAKADWIGDQLRRMDADVVGFQEVWNEGALQNVCARSGLYNNATVSAPGTEGSPGPRVGLATRLPLAAPVDSITRFPDGVGAVVEGVGLPVAEFSRPVLRADLVLDEATGVVATVFVVHLKSKRPILDPVVEQTDPHNAHEEALGAARSLIRRAAEAAALRFLVLDVVVGSRRPAMVIGDLNDGVAAVSTGIVTGAVPTRTWPGDPEVKKAYWDRALYSAHEIVSAEIGRDVSYTHIFGGRYENLDHILVSQEFYARNREGVGEVTNLRYFNDHLIDNRLSDDRPDRTRSDHAQLVAEIRLKRPPL